MSDERTFEVPPWALRQAVFVDERYVNMRDLMAYEPGRLVRCLRDPHECVLFMPSPTDECAFIAGMVSENV